ncbi:MAG: DNA repair protein RecN [Deltaproteobacteria bacterium]|nr:DNA repair protein RecN [Deltaproteobacteria bacterium]
MIERLRIRDLAIVEAAEIAFGPGLNALTGETGAGKSIVLGALALLAGARADARAVREGAEEALVEAVFRTDRAPALGAALRERGLEAEDGELIVARSVSRTGRSRASVAGRLVPVSVLAELFGERLEISSQHESQRLRRPESHGLLLDAFGGLLAERSALTRGYEALRALRAEHAALEAGEAERARRRDFLAFQVGEIDAAGLAPGELDALGAEHVRLAHAEELRAAAAAAAAGLAGDTGGGDAPAALDLVAAAAAGLEGAAGFDPRLGVLAERARGAHAELADLAREVERYADAVEVDPGRRAELEERLATLERLRRKYGRDEAEILARREALGAELAAAEGGDAREAALATELRAAHDALAAQAAALGRGRAAAAARLARDVEQRLRRLEMPDARVEVALLPVAAGEGLPCGPTGAEQAELRLSANRGEAPRALRQIASGGELSRVFLAIQGALRRTEGGMVLVFDEVDAGIGGRTAERVGQALAELASEHQVLCITHLPQVAALAATQLRVVKEVRGGRTVAAVEALDAGARVEELARMAGGARVTEATRQHARELLRAQPPGAPASDREPGTPGRRPRGAPPPSPR